MSSFRFDHRRVEELVSRTTNAVGKALERLRETEALLKKAGPLYPRGIPDNKKSRFLWLLQDTLGILTAMGPLVDKNSFSAMRSVEKGYLFFLQPLEETEAIY